ncbi:MAG: DinB family protein [Candidatus Rokubacteria bacterium]|nr:DinB family protein [Candidatus Rokubacteria bacterium]MBI3827096.1 DinB family protein [Candidatus Rokubacteria bacterium]
MSLDVIREMWEYHHWANRRLFDVVAALGDDVAARVVGPHFTAPTVLGVFTHIHGADRFWLARWQGAPMAVPPGGDIFYGFAPKTLAALRGPWDALEAEQRRFLAGVTEADLGRPFESTRDGKTYSRPFGMLLLHLPNHATHHRSEIAAMLTMLAGPPPDTGLNSFYAPRAPASR